MEWTRDRIAVADGIELAYEDIGAPDAPVILLIMGYASQLIVWPDEFCHKLANGGFRVIRFDNRDVGLSSKVESGPLPGIIGMRLRQGLKLPLKVAYTLDDMTADTVALLDALNIEQAHIVGASMGGMIAQLMAVNYPERVSSLVSLMSSSTFGGTKPKVLWHVLNKAAPDRESQIAHSLKTWQLISSPEKGDPIQALRSRVEAAYDRGHYPPGRARQMAAILAGGSRQKVLPKINAPTLVIHGDKDPMLPLKGAIDTAKLIPNARLEVVAGMGHDLPEALLDELVGLILSHVRGESASE
ncbi:Aclacinomycin methylesterase RdmC [Zhongshania aliphaticivorans]|uniref:Aclacinomycin methylesterase RdmC n=1 Tax=Zhongshania aliphaticivorans TaxID=1470434 RepID=A0A5S9NIE3_9GAMM|nr:alpha/beta hydrolase [Zhongshania aliphaticivorans]CAA0090370.1 Aclacinomycin methylesterase RdmC [Zhongshania aliphaticivorans]CAA0097806.1 Aclacinomycin methylesterase RdmC [Zhongshania aliphaticivorans]